MRTPRRIAFGAVAVAAGALLVGANTVPAAASESAITGSFEYSDLLGGNNRIVDPSEGTCYYVTSVALSGFNNTDARATTYTDLNCTVLGTVVNPGNAAVFPFASVRLTLP
ncbi:hypothetical protein AB0P07_06710 [Streptomyces sp. NPDC085944]|uniref:hypothetical protein n=1 Tax=Streptomyces sp. NPDC085944 TaxID=3154962 RepID=UPI003419E4DB